MNKKLKNVTLVSVTGVNSKDALKALKYSCKEIEFAEVKLITSENITDDTVNIIKCRPLNYIEYSYFIVYDLYKYINTDYAIIVQSDGYIVNPDKWTDKFLDYDYIGAPFPLPSDEVSYRDPKGNIQRVGNGGFSLRSKKILSLAEKLKLEWKSYFGYHNEDGFYACHNRLIYEENGCKYAPLEIASKFSHEHDIPENKGIIPFGFHGKFSKYNILNKNDIIR